MSTKDDKDRSGSRTYEGVYGVFSSVQWDLHQANPSKYPMFRDLVEASEYSYRSIRLDLANAASEAHNFDKKRWC
jgi:hypothetical protein